ncbi:helix-turn-helix domain-containing protein [Archangium gephyra]|nr:AraC family transcriptional regulator [Archangium gephyra]
MSATSRGGSWGSIRFCSARSDRSGCQNRLEAWERRSPLRCGASSSGDCKETGLTVGDWLREHRMSEARRCLLETGASIESIASQVGYTDVTHFIRTFRRVHGMTPRAWREQRRR